MKTIKLILITAIAILLLSCSNDDNKLSNEPKDWLKALEKSNAAAATIQYQGKYYRKDIGFDLK